MNTHTHALGEHTPTHTAAPKLYCAMSVDLEVADRVDRSRPAWGDSTNQIFCSVSTPSTFPEAAALTAV